MKLTKLWFAAPIVLLLAVAAAPSAWGWNYGGGVYGLGNWVLDNSTGLPIVKQTSGLKDDRLRGQLMLDT